MIAAHVRNALVVAFLGVVAVAASARAYVPTGVREIVLTVRHSQFDVSELKVQRGETIRFVVRNTDPIDHELIVGATEVQTRHEDGTEAHHPPRDGEVSVPLFATRSTTYAFDHAETLYFGCHLPGHWDYGMQGRIVVD